MSKVFAIYPPSEELYQRGEDRCQINISHSTVNCVRACNDLGYVSSCLKRENIEVFLKDYQAERLSVQQLISDIEQEKPDLIFISITNSSLYQDIETAKEIKNYNKEIAIILKGSSFFNPNSETLNKLDLTNVDYLVGGEAEFIVPKLVKAHLNDKNLLKEIEGISYKNGNNWVINPIYHYNDNLDELPFPDRKAMKNELYVNPETNKPMALIQTDKGCCFQCAYCLAPVISGNKIRKRSIENIFEEIKDCVNNHDIHEFFFKSDTFTADKNRVAKLCNMLIDSGYNKKLTWCATSRVDTIDEELIALMKKSGCSMLAIGFESGNNESLQIMKKGTTVEQNLSVAKYCKKYGIEILGYFLIGFPWETNKHLEDTARHIFEINADYIEISIIVPYLNTPLYNQYIKNENKDINVLGFDSYSVIFDNFSPFSRQKLQKYRNNILLKYYLRPSYIVRKLKSVQSFTTITSYMKYGLRMLKNIIFKTK